MWIASDSSWFHSGISSKSIGVAWGVTWKSSFGFFTDDVRCICVNSSMTGVRPRYWLELGGVWSWSEALLCLCEWLRNLMFVKCLRIEVLQGIGNCGFRSLLPLDSLLILSCFDSSSMKRLVVTCALGVWFGAFLIKLCTSLGPSLWRTIESESTSSNTDYYGILIRDLPLPLPTVAGGDTIATTWLRD